MMKNHSYNLHDLLSFNIKLPERYYSLKDLNLIYSHYEVDEILAPTIKLNIGKFIPSNGDCYILDHKYHIKDGYFFCRDSLENKNFMIEILGIDKNTTNINYYCPSLTKDFLFPDRLPQFSLLQPLFEYKLCNIGYYLVHSAGLSIDNNGYVFIGRPSSLKSSIAMDLIRYAGFNWLGDDRTLISGDNIFSFMHSPDTIEFKCKYLANENFHSRIDKLNLIKYLLSNAPPSSHITDSSILNGLIFIDRSNVDKIVHRDISSDEAIGRVVENNRAEMVLNNFYKYISAYLFVYPNSRLSNHWDMLYSGFQSILQNTPTTLISIPKDYNKNTFKEILSIMDTLGKKSNV